MATLLWYVNVSYCWRERRMRKWWWMRMRRSGEYGRWLNEEMSGAE
jgi:hypothetical protein